MPSSCESCLQSKRLIRHFSLSFTGVSPEQAPASHVAPLSLTATPASYTLKPVFHEAQGLQPEASALKLMSDAEAAGDTATASERTAPEIKLERSDTDFSEHQFFARYPAVPSSVHSPQYQRPSFPFDPTPSVENSFPLPPPNPVSHFATSGISRSDQVFTHPGRQPPQTDSITPLIPPKPGTFLRTPTSQFLPPNRLGLPQSGMYNRVPQSKITAPWNFSHPPRNGPPQHQMIGPVMGPRNPPHAMSPSQPHKKTPLPVKFHFLNPYSLSEQQLKSQQPLIPQHSQLVPSVVAPPEVLVSHSAAADAYSNGMIADSHASNPSKIYALPTNVKVDPLPAVTPFVSSPTPTVFPVMHYSEKAVEKDGNSFATVQAEASTKSVLELVMNAGTAWNANEVSLHAQSPPWKLITSP